MNNCYIIAEAGLNHNGSIEIAKKLIDIAVDLEQMQLNFKKELYLNLQYQIL